MGLPDTAAAACDQRGRTGVRFAGDSRAVRPTADVSAPASEHDVERNVAVSNAVVAVFRSVS